MSDFTVNTTTINFSPAFKRVREAYYPLFGKLWGMQERGWPEWSGLYPELLSAIKPVRDVFEDLHYDETPGIVYDPLKKLMDHLGFILSEIGEVPEFEELNEFRRAWDAWYPQSEFNDPLARHFS